MRLRGLSASVGLAAAALLVSVLVVELVLRVYAGAADTSLADALQRDPYEVNVEPHGRAGYRPRPSRTIEYYNGAVAHINEQGHRGPTVPVPKPEGVFRIVLLGGSTTFGWGVGDDETIDAHMRSIVAERYPGQPFDIVNLAFDGYDSYQLLERFRSDGAELDPDVVIINSGVNDVRNAWFTRIREGDRRTLLYRGTLDQMRRELALGRPTWWTRAKHWLVLARVPGWVTGQLNAAGGGTIVIDSDEVPYYWDALDYFEGNLRGLIDLVASAGARSVLLSTPPSALVADYSPPVPPPVSYWVRDAATTQIYRDSLSTRLVGLARDDAEELDVRFVAHDKLALELFLDDAHLTSMGNRVVATHFVDAIGVLMSPHPTNDRP